MTIFRRWVTDRSRSSLWWALGIAFTVLVTMALYPTMHSEASMDDLLKNLPDSLKSAFGISDDVTLTSPAGYLQSQLTGTTLPVLLLIFGIAAGARAIGGTEEEGTLELLLANPVSRRRVVVERALGVTAQIAGLGAVTGLVTIGCATLFDARSGITMVGFVAAMVAIAALGLLHASVAFAVGAAIGRRGPAVAVAAAVAVAGYLLQTLGSAADVIRPIAVVSPWHWFLERNMLAQGAYWPAVLAPLALSLVIAHVGMFRFQRRDLR